MTRQSADWEKLASQQSADWEVPNLPYLQSSPIKVSPSGGNWFAKYRRQLLLLVTSTLFADYL